MNNTLYPRKAEPATLRDAVTRGPSVSSAYVDQERTQQLNGKLILCIGLIIEAGRLNIL
jgi:hypothetical protein